jgi:hypothetical protein
VPDDELDEPTTPQIDPSAHANLQLENALLRAGVDLDSPQGQLIRDANAGKTPDVDAIKAQWALVQPQPEPVVETPPERIEGESQQAEERRALAASSTIEPDPADLDPMEESMRAAFEVRHPKPESRQKTGTENDAIATAFHMRGVAGGQGDDRVYVK